MVPKLGLRRGDRVLDAGCGSGAISVALAHHGISVLGIDLNFEKIDEAKRAAEFAGVQDRTWFLLGDLRTVITEDDFLDAIVFVAARSQAPDIESCLREFHRVLKPGGRLAVFDEFETGPADPEEHSHDLEADGAEWLDSAAAMNSNLELFKYTVEDAGFVDVDTKDLSGGTFPLGHISHAVSTFSDALGRTFRYTEPFRNVGTNPVGRITRHRSKDKPLLIIATKPAAEKVKN